MAALVSSSPPSRGGGVASRFENLDDLFSSRSFSSREELEAALEDNPFEVLGDFQINNQVRSAVMDQLWDMTPKQQAMVLPLNLRLEGNVADALVAMQQHINEIRQRETASQYIRDLFRKVKLAIWGPRRWAKLFIGIARRFEADMTRYREQLFTAVALDDIEGVKYLKDRIPPMLWLWWAFDLDLTGLAGRRNRPEMLRLLPALQGKEYITAEEAQSLRDALSTRQPPGSRQAILEVQMSQTYIAVVRKAMLKCTEIDLTKLEEKLTVASAGPWRTQGVPACGINCGDRGDYAGWCALHFVAHASAAPSTCVKAARMLLTAKADPDVGDVAGTTPLHAAAFRNNIAAVRLLVKVGASVEAQDLQGCTALLIAARSRHTSVVLELMLWALPPDLHARFVTSPQERRWKLLSPLTGAQLLHEASDGNQRRAQQLVQVGDSNGRAYIHFTDSRGRCPLHHAVLSLHNDLECIEMIRLLVALSAYVDFCDMSGEAPLHYAARAGRHQVIRHLMRLHAHPGLKDKAGRTPLMLAALGADESPPPPKYSGVLVNEGVDLDTFEALLRWNGAGTAPGVDIRTAVPGPNGDKVRELLDIGKGGIPEGAAPEFIPVQEAALAKARALLELGFDDQHIFDSEGRVNRGDRLQLFRIIYRVDPNNMSVEKRARLLWTSISEPLFRMYYRNTLEPRLVGLLQYILLTAFGPRGMAFGTLVVLGQEGRALKPTWDSILEALKPGQLKDRVHEIRQLCFRGPAPKHTKWVGAAWDREGYPREPDSVPWEGLHYVEEETAMVLKSGPSSGVEAFQGNDLPVFLQAADARYASQSNTKQTPHRAEHLQLPHRLYVDETTGAMAYQASRMRTIGERLICPLLQEAIDGLEKEVAAQKSVTNRDFLQYLLEQSVPPASAAFDWREAFIEAWQAVRSNAVAAVWRIPRGLEALTQKNWENTGAGATPPTQAKLLSEEDRSWLLKQQTAKAFVELCRSKAIEDTEDFTSIVVALADETSVQCAEGGNFYTPPPLGTGVQVGSVVVVAAMRTHCELNGLQGHVVEHHPETNTFAVALSENHRIICVSPDNLQRVQELGDGNKLSAAQKKKIFAKRYWHATYGMLLWGRAVQLQPHFAKELRKVVGPSVQIRGPRLRPRADVLVGPLDPPAAHLNKTPLEAELEKKEGQDQFADLLKAEILCPDTASFAHVWAALCHASQHAGDLRSKRLMMRQRTTMKRGSTASTFHGGAATEADADDADSSSSSSGDEWETKVKEEGNGLELDPSVAARKVRRSKLITTMTIMHVHVDRDWEKVFPRCAGIMLTMGLALQELGPSTTPPVKLLAQVELLFTSTLEARYLAKVFQLDPTVDRPATMETERWDPLKSRRKRPVHGSVR
mmetsp:Transcript_40170/g.92325  ORF Transcript_40170/g.92325 Transcript_40170/m.92325 type:complete len:1377 (-) Transcript_40170:64-4194(-)